MDNKILVGVIVIALILVGGYLAFANGPVVSAQGFSSIKAQPDQVSVNLNIETRALTATEAQDKNKEISDKLIVDLIKQGFDRDELKFVNYNVYQEYDWSGGSQKFKGYVVSQQLVVKTNETSKVPSIVDSAISSGALVSYINFELSDKKQNEYKKQALEEASKDAMAKAEAIASGQGKGIGRLVSIQNQEYNYYPMPYYAMKSADSAGGSVDIAAENANARTAAMNIAPQDLEITASISAQYKLSWF